MTPTPWSMGTGKHEGSPLTLETMTIRTYSSTHPLARPISSAVFESLVALLMHATVAGA